LIDFENEKLLLYFMLFLLGALCFRHKVFESKPQSKTLYIIISSIAWIPISIHIFSRVFWVLSMGTLGGLVSPLADRFIWWLGFYLSVLCMVYLLVQTFRWYLDSSGKIWDELNRNSYGVYIIHVIVLGMIALPLLNSTMPALLKFLTLTASTFLTSNLIVSIYRRTATRINTIDQPKIFSKNNQVGQTAE
jgi:hypothetical protein